MENLQVAFSASYILILVLFTLLNVAMWRDGSAIRDDRFSHWPAPGSEDTELGVLMEPEVGHGETEVYTRVQA